MWHAEAVTTPSATGTGLPYRLVGLAFAVLIAAAGAGLVGQLSHPPGGPARAELTWAADGPVDARLDAAVAKLTTIEGEIESLSADARRALATLATGDAAGLRTILERGQQTVGTIELAASGLRVDLNGLPGEEADAAFRFSNATLVRRGAVFAAFDATTELASRWAEVGTRGVTAAGLTLTLQEHDRLVAAAAERGRAAAWIEALTLLSQAKAQLDFAAELRTELFPGTTRNVLDDWLDLHARHDDTLTALYEALRASGGVVTTGVRTAYRNELLARNVLPNDAQAIVVITAELARNGLNQAVLAIEAARAQLDQAIRGVEAG